MKKKFTCLVMCLLVLCLTVLSGCALIEVDSDKYYNAVIVEIKDENGKVVSQITNRELLNGYQSVGYYYQYSGYTQKEAVDMTLTLLENRKIVLMQAEKIWGIDSTGKNLTELEKTYIWEQTASNLQSNLESYLEEEKSEEKEEENTAITYEEYNPTAYLELDGKGNYQIKIIDQQDGILDNYTPSVSPKDFSKEEDRKLIVENLFENNNSGKNFEAYKQYLNDLRYSEKGQNLSKDDASVFDREAEKIYIQCYENYVVEKYSEQLLQENNVSSVQVQDILDLYSSKVRSAYTQYVLEKDSGYDSAVQEKASDVYYYKEGQENTAYFSVLNILFNESKTEAGKYDLIIRKDDGEGNYVEQSNVTVTKNEIQAFITDNISSVITNAQNSSDSDILYDTIKECVFMYNQDPGMQTADASYTIGVNGEGNAVSSFVESFNDAGLALYNDGKGKVGDIQITESEYGIHVLVYTGACKNLFAGIDENFALQDEPAEEGQFSAIELLNKTRVNPMLDKTYFDVLYEELYVDNASYIQQADIDVLRADYSLVYHKGRIPETLKG